MTLVQCPFHPHSTYSVYLPSTHSLPPLFLHASSSFTLSPSILLLTSSILIHLRSPSFPSFYLRSPIPFLSLPTILFHQSSSYSPFSSFSSSLPTFSLHPLLSTFLLLLSRLSLHDPLFPSLAYWSASFLSHLTTLFSNHSPPPSSPPYFIHLYPLSIFFHPFILSRKPHSSPLLNNLPLSPVIKLYSSPFFLLIPPHLFK